MKLLEKKPDGSLVVELTLNEVADINATFVAALLLTVHNKKLHTVTKDVVSTWTDTVIRG